jgi:hypothetical protein
MVPVSIPTDNIPAEVGAPRFGIGDIPISGGDTPARIGVIPPEMGDIPAAEGDIRSES